MSVFDEKYCKNFDCYNLKLVLWQYRTCLEKQLQFQIFPNAANIKRHKSDKYCVHNVMSLIDHSKFCFLNNVILFRRWTAEINRTTSVSVIYQQLISLPAWKGCYIVDFFISGASSLYRKATNALFILFCDFSSDFYTYKTNIKMSNHQGFVSFLKSV